MTGVQRPSPATARLTGWWEEVAAVHREVALRHQHDQLVHHGAIEAFEAAAGRTDAPPTVGLPTFISDSDVHKWLDAVARSLPAGVPDDVRDAFDDTISLLAAAQAADGYLNTWVQTLFPDGRFAHLLTEHELYTTGHLLEAAVSSWEATGDDRLLRLARAMVEVVRHAVATWPATRQDGHPELELALVRLHRATGDPDALGLARRLLERRGTSPAVRRQSLHDHLGSGRRLLRQRWVVARYRRRHVGWAPRPRAAMHQVRITPAIGVRTVRSFLSGRQWQNDRPVRQLDLPSGHAVGFHYLQTAMAMVGADTGDDELRRVGTAAWEREVAGHLYVSGAAGAYPGLEGFAEPYDLDPERAYCETCAAISGILWNRELARLTGEARYEDLAEWQLLNGAAVGMSTDGTRWGYDNPLQVRTAAHRAAWYPIPCCPSNLSRLWASLPVAGLSLDDGLLRVGQLVGVEAEVGTTTVSVDSDLPWAGRFRIRVAGPDRPRRLVFRVPSWSATAAVQVGGRAVVPRFSEVGVVPATASGLSPHAARWAEVDLGPADAADPSDAPNAVDVEIALDVAVHLLRQDPRLPRSGGWVTVARGPLVYCLEGVDHPERTVDDLLAVRLGHEPLQTEAALDLGPRALALVGHDVDGRPLRFVPYFLWGNRAPGPMTAFVDAP